MSSKEIPEYVYHLCAKEHIKRKASHKLEKYPDTSGTILLKSPRHPSTLTVIEKEGFHRTAT